MTLDKVSLSRYAGLPVAVNEKMRRGRKNKGKGMSNRKSQNKREEEL